MYFDQPEDGLDGPISFEMKSILGVMGVVILLFIFLPGPLLSGAEAARKCGTLAEANDPLWPIKYDCRRA